MPPYKYEKGLQDHIRHSDEKILLARAVGNIIDKYNVKSLLDVGAGEGTFSSMIAPHVAHYVAAEKRKENADELRNRGFEVIEGSFPFYIKGSFDMVLASHSCPSDKKSIGPFVENLIEASTDNGVVCVITYKNNKDTWNDFMRNVLKESWSGKSDDSFGVLLDVMRQYGSVVDEKIDTTARGNTPRELFGALRFMYAGKETRLAELFEAHRAEALAWIEAHCRKENGGYEFPFFQHIVTVKKGEWRGKQPDNKIVQ